MAPGPVPYIDGEGGGPNPPYGEDFFQRIVGVHWREPTVGLGVIAIFIFGMASNALGHVAFKDKTPVFGFVELPEPAANFYISGSSYAVIDTTPVFLVCGVRSVSHDIVDSVGDVTAAIDTYSVIYASNDGANWAKVFEHAAITSSLDDLNAVNAVALVWNPVHRLFYFDQFRSHVVSSTSSSNFYDEVYSSSNGVSWGQISSTEATGPDYVSTFPSYCINNVCIDSLGQNVPDGVAWQAVNIADAEINIAAAVAPVIPPSINYFGGNVFFSDSSNEIIIAGPKPRIGSIVSSAPGMKHIYGVASAGRIIMAGGESAASDPDNPTGTVAYTWDGGTTWDTLRTFPTPISTLIVGYVKRSINLPF
jgi:hypothetical protein